MSISIPKNRLSNPWTACIVVAATTLAVYSNIYHSAFVFDDLTRIVNETEIRKLTNYFSPDKILSPRGIVWFTFALQYKIGKLDVFGYHLVNVLIHIVNGCIVYFLAFMIFTLSNRVFSYSRGKHSEFPDTPIQSMALFSSLVFVAHPVQTQAVTYTVQRFASMAALFYLASVLFYLKSRIVVNRLDVRGAAQKTDNVPGKRVPIFFRRTFKAPLMLYTSALFCGMLAFLCKQNAATLPVALLLVEYIFIDRTLKGWKKKIPWFTAFFVLWVLFVLYTSWHATSGSEGQTWLENVSGMTAETEIVSRWRYLCTQFNVVVIYIKLLFLPVKQNLDYFYAFKNGFFDGLTPLAFTVLVVIAGCGLLALKRHPVITFSIFFFFITLSVESSIFPIRDAMYEHRLYLPMFGFALFITHLLFTFLRDKNILAFILPFLVIVSLGTSAYMRNRVWQNSLTLWSDVVSKAPFNYRGHINLGVALYAQGRPGEAIAHYREALRIKPDSAEALNNLALALSGIGHLEESARCYKTLLEVDPDDPSVQYNFGMYLYGKGNIKDAGDHFSRAIELKPDYAEAYNILGIVRAKQGDFREAEIFFSKALEINPEYDDPLKNLAALKQMPPNKNGQAAD